MDVPLNYPRMWNITPFPIFSDSTIWRFKNNKRQVYKISSNVLGKGNDRLVYEIISLDGGKPKALRVGKHSSKKEYELLQQLNPSGAQTGIVRPSKYFLWAESFGFSFEILSKYTSNLGKLLFSNLLTEQEAIESLRQIFLGVKFLHASNIFHGDLHEGNILCGTWKSVKRYDISDFEHATDISTIRTLEDLKKNDLDVNDINHPQLSLERLSLELQAHEIQRRLLVSDFLVIYNRIIERFIKRKIISNPIVIQMIKTIYDFPVHNTIKVHYPEFEYTPKNNGLLQEYIVREFSVDAIITRVLDMQKEVVK